MNNPIPTPAPDIAAIIAEAQGACACFCPGVECSDMKARTCPSVAALLAAATRPAPVADGEVAQLIGEVEKSLSEVRGQTLLSRYWPYILGVIEKLSGQVAAAEARAGKAEKDAAEWKAENGNLWKQAEQEADRRALAESRAREMVEQLRGTTVRLRWYACSRPRSEDSRRTIEICEAAERFTDARAARAALSAAPAPALPDDVRHGVNCRKQAHDNPHAGYLHGVEDDGPYNVDGVAYCGRCHLHISPAVPQPAPATAMPEAIREAHSHGTLAALDVVLAHDAETIAREILGAGDAAHILKTATADEYHRLAELKAIAAAPAPAGKGEGR